MDLSDYRSTLSDTTSLRGTLRGVVVPTPWDPELAVEMERLSVGVMEERLLDVLLEHLAATS